MSPFGHNSKEQGLKFKYSGGNHEKSFIAFQGRALPNFSTEL